MKNLFLINLLLLFILSGCNKDEPCCKESPEPTCCSEKKEEQGLNNSKEGPSDLSIYNLSSEWINQDAEKIKLESFQGKPYLMAFIYTTCSYACPRIISDLKNIEEKLSKNAIENYGILLVTMDPETDTPEVLKNFANENKLDLKRWKLLTGDPENIRELSILFNMKYKKTASEISHSNIISVLNEEGEIVYQEEGLGVDSEGTVRALKNLLQK